VTATNISCTNLTVDGEPVSSVLQNIGESSIGETVFVGDVQADTFTTTGALTAGSISSTTTNAGVLTSDSITNNGSISTLSLGATGDITQSGTSATLTQTGTSATASLKATSVTTLTATGTSTLATVNATSMSASGNLTVTGNTELRAGIFGTYSTANDSVGTSFTNATLGAGKYMGWRMGKAGTTNNAWQMRYYNIGEGTATNRLACIVEGQTTPTLSMIHGKVGVNKNVPTEALDVNGNVYASGDMEVAGSFTNQRFQEIDIKTEYLAVGFDGTKPPTTIINSNFEVPDYFKVNRAGIDEDTIMAFKPFYTTAGIEMTGTSAKLRQTGASATANLKATTATSLSVTGTTQFGDNVTMSGTGKTFRLNSNKVVMTSSTAEPNEWYMENNGNNLFIDAFSPTNSTTAAGFIFRTSVASSGSRQNVMSLLPNQSAEFFGDITQSGVRQNCKIVYVSSFPVSVSSTNLLTGITSTYGGFTVLHVAYSLLRKSADGNLVLNLTPSGVSNAYIGSTSGTSNIAHSTGGIYLWDSTLLAAEYLYGEVTIRAHASTGGQRYYTYNGNSSNGARTVNIAGRVNWSIGTGNPVDALQYLATAGTFNAGQFAIELR